MEIPQPWMARGPVFREPAVEEIAKDWLWDGCLNMGYHQNRKFKKDKPLDLGASYAQTRKNLKKHFQEWSCETHGTSCPHQPTNMCERFLAIVTSKRWHLRGDKGALYHGSMVIYKIIASCPTVDARGPQNEEKNHCQLPHSRCPRSPKWGEKSFVSGRCFIWRGWDSPCSITTLSDSKPSWQIRCQ